MTVVRVAEGIVRSIKSFPSSPIAFNQYVDFDTKIERDDAPVVRSNNLERYLECMATVKGRDLWLFEAPSRRGAVRTGVPQTSASKLNERAEQIGLSGGFRPVPSHTPDTADPSETSKRVAAFFGSMLVKPLLWNAVMIHTRDARGANRNPSKAELRQHQHILRAVYDLCEPRKVIACGETAQIAASLVD